MTGGAVSPVERRAVVVLGMHRSGTSLLAAMLQVLGVDLGQDLLRDGVPDNEEGYWEHAGIVACQEAVLEAVERAWYRPEGLLPMPPGWWRRPEIGPQRRRLVEIVRTETAVSVGVWGFKDPRTVRLLPMWREVFAAAGVRPVYVLAIRHPLAVARSLARRDGMTLEAGQLLWLQHTLDAFAHAGDAIRIVVDYDRWFAEPVATAREVLRRLDLTWPADDDALDAAVASVVRPDLRHDRAGDPGRLIPEVREFYELLRAAAPDAPSVAPVAELRRRLDDAQRLLQPWSEAAPGRRRLEGEIEALGAQLRAADVALQASRAETAVESARADAFARDHADLRRQHEALHGRHVELGAALVAADKARAAERAADLAAFAAERDALRADIDRGKRVLDAVMPDPAEALDRLWDSASLRLYRRLQGPWRRLTRRPPVQKPAVDSPESAARAVAALRDSVGWHATGPLRALTLLAGRLRR